MNHEQRRSVSEDAKGVADATDSPKLAQVIDDLFRQPAKFGAPEMRKTSDHTNRRLSEPEMGT
jgi:hypothetical protein